MKPRPREIYVEGGGDQNPSLASECRRAFSKLFEAAGINPRPKVIVCGTRRRAYDSFCRALTANSADVLLLVDAEDPLASGPPFDPWTHVKLRQGDQWERPAEATDKQLHLMNVVMETWLVADLEALKKIFGPKFDGSKLPALNIKLESVSKAAIYAALKAATKPTPAGEYGKGSHSFKALALVAPEKLRTLSWADRFLGELESP